MFFHNPNCGILEKAQWGADEDFIMEKIGIVFGCFIPLHKGHESLIERALAENDRMIIAVCGYQQDRGKDFLPFTMRYKLVKEIFRDNPRVIVEIGRASCRERVSSPV